jgi:CDGSH-type Zn-finger protein
MIDALALAHEVTLGIPAAAATPLMTEPTAPTPGPEPLDLPAGVHQLCSCGRSRHGWFCDGAHLGSGRVFYELRLNQPATLRMCRCERSRRYPLCDGSHGIQQRRPWWRPLG